MPSRTKAASSNRGDSENPPTPESSSMEIEIVEATEVSEADGFLRDSKGKSSRLRNAVILILVLLALSLTTSNIFDSKDVAIPSSQIPSSPQQTADFNNAIGDDLVDLDVPEETHGNEDPDGSSSSSGGDSENSNVVDLNAKNPKRDGVKFISPSCNYTCRTDRLPHESPLYPGQVLCNENMRFGMTESSELFIQDCQADVQTILWSAKGTNWAEDLFPVHFEMKKNGYFEIISDAYSYVLFEAHPQSNVTYHKMCLHHNPKLDCPYLHLHKDGVLVLNWIQEHPYEWKAQNVQRQYDWEDNID